MNSLNLLLLEFLQAFLFAPLAILLAILLIIPMAACATTTSTSTVTQSSSSKPANSPAASPAGVTATSAASTLNLPKEPNPIHDKTAEYSILTEVRACSGTQKEVCSIETFVVAKAKDNGDLIWDRRIYFRRYDVDKEIAKQVIGVKSLAFTGTGAKKMIRVNNSRGDVFDLETGHGHLKTPKEPKEYH